MSYPEEGLHASTKTAASVLAACLFALSALSGAFVSQRVWTQRRIRGRIWLDDALLVVAWVSIETSVGYRGCRANVGQLTYIAACPAHGYYLPSLLQLRVQSPA